MYLWKPNSCLHQLDVQEANVSIPRFHRIRNHFIGCWTVNGWITCSRPLGCGNWSVTFIEEYRINNPSGSKKLLAKSQIQNPNKRETEMLINCRMWTTPPQTHILLKASISCTSVKIMRLWSRWLSKVEIQQWDVSRTHRVALDWLFDRINLKPNPKSNMLTPKTNLLTCSPKGVHAWQVESSSLVQHHGILDVLLQPFQQFYFWSDRKADRHHKERSRSDFQWETCTGSDSRDRASEHEVHKPSIHDESLPFFKRSWGLQQGTQHLHLKH